MPSPKNVRAASDSSSENVLADLPVGSGGTGTPACAPSIPQSQNTTPSIGQPNPPSANSASPVSASRAPHHARPNFSSSETRHPSLATRHFSSKVFLLGAGPGDPELLTLKALRVLQSADVVLHDSLIGPEILNLIPPTAERIDVGKRAGFRLLTQQDINSLLLANAAKHKIVVRLKGGDPLLFGRAAEELQALREANIPFEIVPGIMPRSEQPPRRKFLSPIAASPPTFSSPHSPARPNPVSFPASA